VYTCNEEPENGYFFIKVNNKCVCLICNASVAASQLMKITVSFITNPFQETDISEGAVIISSVFNLLKTKRICFIQELSAYRAVNTLHFGYKNQSLKVL
jgi:hypothetical protein